MMDKPQSKWETVEWYLWEPIPKWGATLDEARCRYGVTEAPHYIRSRQCARKAVKTVGGYGFCKQHARKVREKTGEEEATT